MFVTSGAALLARRAEMFARRTHQALRFGAAP
jgi:hypothetical protein